MSKLKIRVSKKAISDLESIWKYTSKKWSREQADRYYKLITEEFQFIAENPQAGKPMDHLITGYKASIIKSHMIFYKIDQKETIDIVRILHQRMDVDENLK